MCGIGGILRTDGQPIPEEWLDAIDARIAYRGPDGAGRFRDRVTFTDEQGRQRVVEVAFVHRRLSIIDHKDGHQPMVSERGRNESEGLVAVVFNGCIYNHRELRRELEAKGHRFVTDHSDTEVLIHGWREWGHELRHHLEGMYAFALWDRSGRRLHLARDPFGEKPLYRVDDSAIREGENWSVIAFASERHSVEQVPLPRGRSRGWDVLEFLQLGYLPVHSNPAQDQVEVARHSSVTYTSGDGLISRQTMVQGRHVPDFDPRLVEEALEEAVRRRLEADVPLGCFLSGGVDSSLIAHFARKHKPDLMTFTVRMPDARYDESRHAERVAAHLGVRHQTLDFAVNPAEDVVHLIQTLGQPFGDSSILPTYWVSKAARQHVKVALAGDGGDELFFGYERYLAARPLAQFATLAALMPNGLLHRAHSKSRRNKLARFIDMARDYRSIGIVAMEVIFRPREIKELTGRRPALPQSPNDGDVIELLRDLDLDHYLPGDLLRKTDTASMAVALEVRCPFLDADLAALLNDRPVDELIPGGERKGLLRRIARKYLPKECVDRPKMGFAIPIGEWFRSDDLPHKGSGMKTLLLDHLNSAEPFGPIQLNRKTVQRFIDEHMSGKRDHGQRLFTLLTLSIWARGAG
ncbi:MAG: asparagine synthase (glutamine-hydrolyzing) [Phycisphaerales bacterium]|nr:asparagine synthase (glutamine-hydrolyzing) [Phycisphaerales bacterium]